MASITLPSHAKTIKTNDGTTYGLVHVKAKESSIKPTLLFLHGYPSSSYDWRYQIEIFSAVGYEIIVPDLLGYGDTDRPASFKEYSMFRLAGHVEEICDQLGSGLLSAAIKRSQERFVGFAFAAVGYVPKPIPDIDAFDVYLEKVVGRGLFGYWKFHGQDDAAEVIENNAEAYLSLFYPDNPELWITDLCPNDRTRAWTESGEVKPRPSWLSEEEYETHVQILQKGGWTGPLNWFKQALAGITGEAGKNIPEDRKSITKPVFYIGASKDYAALEDLQRGNTQDWAKNGFKTVSIDAGHWLFIEKRKEFDDALAGWLDRTFASKTTV